MVPYIYTSPVVFLDHKNVGVAVCILLLSCVEAKIYVFVIPTFSLCPPPPVYDHLDILWFEYSHQHCNRRGSILTPNRSM